MIKKLRYKIQKFPVEKISRFTYIAPQITPSAAQVALWLSAIYGVIRLLCLIFSVNITSLMWCFFFVECAFMCPFLHQG